MSACSEIRGAGGFLASEEEEEAGTDDKNGGRFN